MCGFSVLVSKKTNKKNLITETQLINKLIKHRGPDSTRYIFGKEKNYSFCMFFNRLKIIDLSNKANQPFEFKNRYLIVFNGEIYNYLEIKNYLKKKKIKFKTNSDTEVLIAAYSFWGKDCFKKLNGMWSFVIYDKLKKEFIACRDRYGVKPLYYQKTDDKLTFCSEIKQLRNTNKKKVNNEKIKEFLSGRKSKNLNSTFFENIFQLDPGHYLIYSKNRLKKKRWYYFKNRSNDSLKLNSLKDLLRKELTESVKKRLRSDVKVGLSLSGGIDSSTIGSLIWNESNSPKNINTFSTISKDINNESKYIREFLNKYKFRNFKEEIKFKDFRKNLEKFVWTHDEPVSNLTVYSEWLNYKNMKKNKIKVNLDGHGADEIFCGYENYFSLNILNLIKSFDLKNILVVLKHLIFLKISNKKNFILKILINLLSLDMQKKIKNKFGKNFNSDWIKLKHRKQIKKDQSKNNSNLVLGENYNQFFYTSLVDQLKWSDRNSMHHSIEARSPFLDYNIVEKFLLINSNYKINGLISKFILREAFRNILPKKIYERNFKVGFSAPDRLWIEKNYIYVYNLFKHYLKYLNDVITNDCKNNIFKIISGKKRYNEWIWKILFLGAWVKVNKIKFDD